MSTMIEHKYYGKVEKMIVESYARKHLLDKGVDKE